MSGVRGDFAALAALAKKLKRAGAPIRRAVLTNIGEEVIELVREGFSQEAAPDGAPWAPLKTRQGKILQDTGRLRTSFNKRVTSRTVEIRGGTRYGGYHQTGTRKMPARPMVPANGLPASWARALVETAEEAIGRYFRG